MLGAIRIGHFGTFGYYLQLQLWIVGIKKKQLTQTQV